MRSRTIHDLEREYLRVHSLPHKKPKSHQEDERLFRVHIRPDLGSLRVRSTKTRSITDWHLERQDRPYVANRALNLLSHAFNLAEGWGWRAQGTNPCKGVRRFRENPRSRYLSQFELRRLSVAIDQLREEDRITAASARAVRVLLLTGCRKGEILGARWDEIDWDAAVLRLSDSKTGPRDVPLSEPALEELRRAPKASEFIFPGRRKGQPLKGLQKAWERIREVAGLRDARVHDLRRTFATTLRRQGYDLETIGEILGQRRIETTRIYARFPFELKQEAAEKAADELLRALRVG